MAIRAIRGAIQVDRDDQDEILAAVAELVTEVLHRNGLDTDDLISILFTSTDDLHAEFPAYAARMAGITDVPLLCARELDINGAMQTAFSPLIRALNTLPGILGYAFLVTLLWSIGINGDNTMDAVVAPIFLQYLDANVKAMTAGHHDDLAMSA